MQIKINKKFFKKSKKILSDPGLFTGLFGSALNYADNIVMAGKQGHGFAAEKANHIWDILHGKNAKIIGGNNIKNGADRLVNGINIQTKYCKTGSRCVNECFDNNGQMKYINSNGTPMKIEVPSDKFDDALKAMQNKIKQGKVKGVTDPSKAKNIIKKGEFTYQQAVNIAKFGTIESLTYDTINGLKLAGTSMGISSAISFGIAIWNGKDWETALKNSVYSSLKVSGVTWTSSIIAAQFGRTGLEQVLRGTTDYIVKSMGSKTYHFLANGLRSGSKIYGGAAINNVSKVLRGNLVTGIATTLVLSTEDFYRLFNGKISGTQVFKNVTKTGISVAGGVGGWMGGAAAGAVAGSALPIVGTTIGGIFGGFIGSFIGGNTAYKVAETVLDTFIEDDAKEMLRIIEKVFGELSYDYLLNEKEAKQAIEEFQKKDVPDELRNMFASDDSNKYAKKLLEIIIIDIVRQRSQIILPTNHDIIKNMIVLRLVKIFKFFIVKLRSKI